jgi:hypothetical protein
MRLRPSRPRWFHGSVLATGLLLACCTHEEPRPAEGSNDRTLEKALEEIRIENLRKHVFELADDRYEGRNAGHDGERRAAEYVAAQFRSVGLLAMGDPQGESRVFLQAFAFRPRRPPTPTSTLTSHNVIGLLEGTDPSLRGEYVLVGAHHDAQGMEGQADPGRDPRGGEPADRIWNGADDNASGVAALLEVARVLAANRAAANRSVLFVSFGAEEHGLDGEPAIHDPKLSRCGGSEHYARHPPYPVERHVAMVNLELLGRNPEEPLEALATDTSPIWTGVLEAAKRATGHCFTIGMPLAACDGLDHFPFGRRGIPAILLGVPGDRSVYHRRSDHADGLSYDRLTRATRFALAVLIELANRQP